MEHDIPLNKRHNFWFMQEGDWQPGCPEFTTLEFYYWGYIKCLVNGGHIENL